MTDELPHIGLLGELAHRGLLNELAQRGLLEEQHVDQTHSGFFDVLAHIKMMAWKDCVSPIDHIRLMDD